MALHQLFTLAFALHLEPLPTLDYAAVPYTKDASRSSDSLQEPDKLRVGANTKLDPIYTRHLPHSVDTLSFLLNHTCAIEAVEPFSKLIRLLDEADDDPEFRNLREFFDTRYGDNGLLVRADKESHRRMRSISRAASTKQSATRPSHNTEARKPSFAASLGGTSALKLNWLRRHNTNNSESQHHQASDDEDSQSRVSSSARHPRDAPPSAPYIRLAKRHAASPRSSLSTSSGSHHRGTDREASNLVTFRVRLDLHTVGLAPPPPKFRSHRPADAASSGLHRVSSGRSATSSDWKRRRPRGSSLSNVANALRPVTSPDSHASSVAASSGVQQDADNHSGFARLAIDTAVSPSNESPIAPASIETNLARITEGAVTSPSQPTSPTPSNKPARRPSMMSKLLDFGRKKSFLDRAAGDHQDGRSTSFASANGDPTESRAGPTASGQRASFRSSLNQQPGVSTPSNDEALDLDDDDEAALRARIMRQTQNDGSTKARRRSSAGSSGNNHTHPRPTYNDLRPVQEDGPLDLSMVASRSSADTAFSGPGMADESVGGDASAEGARLASAKAKQTALMDGGDFLSLFRAASTLGLKSIEDPHDNNDVDKLPAESRDGGEAVTTPSQENVRSPFRPSTADTGSTNAPSIRTPQVHPTRSSLPSTPGRSVRSLDLDRSPNPTSATSNPIDASFKLGASLARKKRGEEDEAWWPCGDVDPLPISLASALGEALGWEGIMHLCYGRGSRAAAEGLYVALGKAAALDEASKLQEQSVLAWRTGVASAGASPPKADSGFTEAAESLSQKLNLDSAPHLIPDTTTNSSLMGRLNEKAPQRSTTVPQPSDMPSGTAAGGAAIAWDHAPLLFGSRVKHSRTWKHWQALFKSIKGWVDEYERTRVRSGLAREIGLDQPVESLGANEAEAGDSSIVLSAPATIEPGSHDMQVPLTVGSPPNLHTEVLKAPRSKVDATTLSKVLGTSLSISPCVLADVTNRAHGFRRRVGIPEGLPLGPEDEETIDYSWSRKKLSVEHFATALTISSDSALHYFSQLSSSDWTHRSGWELDYLEMCVFKSPLVADRFPPPGEAVVPASKSYRPAEGAEDRSRLCPVPDQGGAWNPDTWKRWLSWIREGDIIVPAVAWQAWWTLISVLNGADRTGRCYDLQVKTPEEPFEALTDLNAVYL